MRRILTLAVLLAVAAFAFGSASASAASLKSCADVNTKIGGKNYKVATKVQVKGLTCTQAKAFAIGITTGEKMDTTLEALRPKCKSDKNQTAAMKARRTATTCQSANGKRLFKAWLLNG